VFAAVEKGECYCGIIPIENSNSGTMSGVRSHLASHTPIFIVGEYACKDGLCLVGPKDTVLSNVRRVYSHPLVSAVIPFQPPLTPHPFCLSSYSFSLLSPPPSPPKNGDMELYAKPHDYPQLNTSLPTGAGELQRVLEDFRQGYRCRL
jgi:hypothetical protein